MKKIFSLGLIRGLIAQVIGTALGASFITSGPEASILLNIATTRRVGRNTSAPRWITRSSASSTPSPP
jgi:hypothetical protein